MSDVFTSEGTTLTTPPQGDDVLATKLQSIVNEKGEPKYADVGTALEALKNSQEYIPTLKSQMEEKEKEIFLLREQLAKTSGVQETIEEFTKKFNAQQPETKVETPTKTLGETKDIDSLVQAAFENYTQQNKSKENYTKVISAVESKYGEQAKSYIATKAKELDTTPEQLAELAKNNPTMTLSLLGISEKIGGALSYGGSTNTVNFQQQKQEPLGPPKTSMLSGASREDLKDFMAAIEKEVYSQYGITE